MLHHLDCHQIDAAGRCDYDLLLEAMNLIPHTWFRQGVAYCRSYTPTRYFSPEARMAISGNLLKGRTDVTSSTPLTRGCMSPPFGYPMETMEALRRAVILTPPSNLDLLRPGLFIEPKDAVVIFNIGKDWS